MTRNVYYDNEKVEISTHTPLTGRDMYIELYYTLVRISTHTPLTGRDFFRGFYPHVLWKFLLTRPLRDVT